MHSELLARLEAATGPDRELDRDIADAFGLGPPADWQRKPRNLPGGGVYLDCGSWVSPSGGLMRHSQPYTASIDVALTLAEDKDETLREALRWLNKRFHLHINPWPEGENYAQWLALAIVIAALRAKGDA